MPRRPRSRPRSVVAAWLIPCVIPALLALGAACARPASFALHDDDAAGDGAAAIQYHAFLGNLSGFLEDNPEGGFLSHGTQLLYAAPEAADTAPVLAALQLDAAPSVALAEAGLPGDWRIVDVSATRVLPPRVVELIGRRSIYDGPRCYGAALYAVGYSQGPMNHGPTEFAAWARSPLVVEIDASQLAAGDVIALGPVGAGIPTEHVAYMATNELVFQKGGSISNAPYELVTLASFHHRYPAANRQFRYFRMIKSVDELFTDLGEQLPAAAQQLYDRAKAYEAAAAPYFLSRRDTPDFPFDQPDEALEEWYEAFDALVSEMRSFQDASADTIAQGRSAAVTAEMADLAFAWRMLELRLAALAATPGPYD